MANEEMARRMKVEYSESTWLIGKSQKTDAKKGKGARERRDPGCRYEILRYF